MGELFSINGRALLPLLPVLGLVFACCASPSEDMAGGEKSTENVAKTSSVQQSLITGEVGQWKWTSVPGSQCGDGSETGFAVNLGTSDEVVIAMMGGGMCWDELTCTAEFNGVPLAMRFKTGFNESTFKNQDRFQDANTFTREPTNPYKDATFVYIPYCTGDAHLGDAVRWFPVQQKNAYFKGAHNLDLFLAQLVPAFTGATRFTLIGISAGAFGATIQYDHIRQAFGGTRRMDLVADSAPIFYHQNTIWGSNFGQWGAQLNIPAGCPSCATNLKNLYAYYDSTYTNSRFAILSHSKDYVIGAAYPQFWYPQFYSSLKSLSTGTLNPLLRTRYFIPNQTNHTLLAGPGLDTIAQPRKCDPAVTGSCSAISDGSPTVLRNWLGKMHDNDPAWSSVTGIIQAACTPNCAGATCGADGCGGVCGTCATDMACHSTNQCLYSKGCTINGVNYDTGAKNPAVSCQVCDPSANPFGWSIEANSCLISGQCKTAGQADSGSGCTECRPRLSQTGWSVGSACNVVAVTDSSFEGNFGYSNAVSKCAVGGSNLGLNGTFKPLVSTGSQNYIDAVPLARRSKPVVNTRGQQLFSSWNAVFSNQVWPSGTSIYTFGDVAYGGKVWTGTETDGTTSSGTAARCAEHWDYPLAAGWSTKGYFGNLTWHVPKALVGDFASGARQFVRATSNQACDVPARLSCVLTP